VAFSFFKKDPKDARRPLAARAKPAGMGGRTGASEAVTRPSAKPLGRPLSGPSTRFPDRPGANTGGPAAKPLPDQDRVRDQARLTTAKIDAIEAEMARDLMGGPRTTTASPPPTTIVASAGAGPSTVARTTVIGPRTLATQVDEDAGENSGLGGDIDAIEINTASGSSIIDECAILFSNGQIEGAEAVLRAGLRRDDLGSGTRLAWLMLFELVNHRGDRAGYEQLAMDYALRFEHSPPVWIDDSGSAAAGRPAVSAPTPSAATAGASVHLPASIDAGIVGQLEKLRGLTATHAAVQLDVSDAGSIDINGAGLLLRVLGAFSRSQRELTLVGAATLAEVLMRSVESGRRDPSDALWMLLLEVLRMLNRHDEFEETAIQYCITFEVSPPSWEPPPDCLKVAAAAQSPAAGGESANAGAPFQLRGTIDGEGEPYLVHLAAAARGQPEVVIECSQLRRLSFSAGSALLGTLRRIRQSGATIEMRQVSALISALLHLLGVSSIAAVQSRHT
jgi:anti-anti-sigma regulatory factor